jgi:hypothetical protein
MTLNAPGRSRSPSVLISPGSGLGRIWINTPALPAGDPRFPSFPDGDLTGQLGPPESLNFRMASYGTHRFSSARFVGEWRQHKVSRLSSVRAGHREGSAKSGERRPFVSADL